VRVDGAAPTAPGPTPPASNSPTAPPAQNTPTPSVSNPEPSNSAANSPLEELLLPVIAPIVEPIVEPVIGSIAEIFDDVSDAFSASPQLSPVRSRAASLGLISTSEVASSTDAESTIVDSEASQNLMNDLGKVEPKNLSIEPTTDQPDWQAFAKSDQFAWIASAAGTIAFGLAGWFAFAKLKASIALGLRRTSRLARLS
jgi:hypothetical protein